MNEVPLFQTLEKLNAHLENWKKNNHLILNDIRESLSSHQTILIPPQIANSQELKLVKFQEMQCEYCKQRNNIKYICSSDKAYQQKLRYFILCVSCFHGNKLPQKISKSNYLLMNDFVDSFMKREKNNSRELSCILQSCQNQRKKLITEFVSKLSIKAEGIGDSLQKQIENLLSLSSKDTYNLQQSLFQESLCNCQNSCCYCSDKQKKTKNCNVNKLKENRITFVKNFHHLKIISMLNSKLEELMQMLKEVFLDFESILLESLCNIEKVLNAGALKLSALNLHDENLLQKIQVNKREEKSLTEQEYFDNKIKEHQISSSQKGKIDFMTSQNIQLIKNNQKQIEIQYCHEDNVGNLQAKFTTMNSVQKLSIQSQQFGDKLIQELNQKTKIENSIFDSSLKESIQQIEFNFNMKNKNITLIPSKFNNIKKIDVYGNFFSNFHRIYDIIGTSSPQPLELELFASQGYLRNLWIGNWSMQETKKEIDIYCKILQKSFQKLEGIMLGTNIGKDQFLCPNLIQILKKKPPNLKILILNQIKIEKQVFIDLLNSLPELQGIFLNNCKMVGVKDNIKEEQQITKEIHQAINKLKHLKKLGITKPSYFFFDQPLPELETFILGSCFQTDLDSKLLQFLQHSTLFHLNLNGCCYLTEDTINKVLKQQVKNGNQLNQVNLEKTKISNKTLETLNLFTNLTSLNIGSTQISLCHMLKDLKKGKLRKLQTIKKLLMRDMNYLSTDLSETKIKSGDASETLNQIVSNIVQHFPLLFYLDISNNSKLNESCIREGLQNLVYLIVKETSFSQSLKPQPRKTCPYGHKKVVNLIDQTLREPLSQSNLEVNEPSYPILKKRKYLKIIS